MAARLVFTITTYRKVSVVRQRGELDTNAGDTKGQGVGGVWYILGPKANIMK